MKKLLFLVLFSVIASAFTLNSCSKESNTNVPVCDFFPIYKGKTFTYLIAPGNQTGYSYEKKYTAPLDSTLVFENFMFILKDCDQGSVFLRWNNIYCPIVDNSKSSELQTIYADSKVTVTQRKDMANFIYSSIKYNNSINPSLEIKFVPGKGVYFIEDEPRRDIRGRRYYLITGK